MFDGGVIARVSEKTTSSACERRAVVEFHVAAQLEAHLRGRHKGPLGGQARLHLVVGVVAREALVDLLQERERGLVVLGMRVEREQVVGAGPAERCRWAEPRATHAATAAASWRERTLSMVFCGPKWWSPHLSHARSAANRARPERAGGTATLFLCANVEAGARRASFSQARHGASAATRRTCDMEYTLLIYADQAAFETISPAQMKETQAAYHAYTEALQRGRRAARRQPPASTQTATTVRLRSGKTEVLNGPYAETREQLGGYYLVDVARPRCGAGLGRPLPGASHGVVEVRPVWAMDADDRRR
jgi:hypothetical protein